MVSHFLLSSVFLPFGENCCFLQLMWSVANSLELRGPKGWWLMRPNIAAAAASLPPPFLTKIPITILANIPFLSPRLQLSEIERISELSQFSAESGERTHLLLPFFSAALKLESWKREEFYDCFPVLPLKLDNWVPDDEDEKRKGERKEREKRRWDYGRFYWRKCQTPDQSNLLMLLSSSWMHSGQKTLQKLTSWKKCTSEESNIYFWFQYKTMKILWNYNCVIFGNFRPLCIITASAAATSRYCVQL